MKGTDKCRSCPAPVRWAHHTKPPYKSNPLDIEPSPESNLLISRDDAGGYHYSVLTGSELEKARADGVSLYLSHFVTCPNAKAHRKSEEVDAREILFGQRKEVAA